MIAIIFLCIMKSHLFAMFLWNFTTTSLSIAFYKKVAKNCCFQAHAYWRDVNHVMEWLIEEWCDLDHNIICAAVNQWRTRLRACMRADGGHFEHQL